MWRVRNCPPMINLRHSRSNESCVSWNLPQDKPESFETLHRGSTSEALQRASEVLSAYWELVTTSDAPVDWRCQHEYTDAFGSTPELYTESPTPYFTGGNLFCPENELMIGLRGAPLRSAHRCLFSPQTVTVAARRRPRTEGRSETCTCSASSWSPSADCY